MKFISYKHNSELKFGIIDNNNSFEDSLTNGKWFNIKSTNFVPNMRATAKTD